MAYPVRDIVAIRSLKQVAAEAAAGRAAAVLREKSETHAAYSERRDGVEARLWQNMAEHSLPVELLPMWSRELLRLDGLVVRAKRDTDHAAEALDNKRQAWQAAERRLERAKSLARRADEKRLEQRDDAVVAHALDRIAYDWSVSR
jgi:hypothetical protein